MPGQHLFGPQLFLCLVSATNFHKFFTSMKLYFNIVVLLVVFDRITVFIAGCDGGRWAHSDGRGVWRRGRASDHAARKHTVRRHQRSGWWRRLHKLAGARQQQSLEQQAAHRAGQQAREYGLTTLPVGDNMRNTLLNHQGGALSCSLSLSDLTFYPRWCKSHVMVLMMSSVFTRNWWFHSVFWVTLKNFTDQTLAAIFAHWIFLKARLQSSARIVTLGGTWLYQGWMSDLN